MLKVTYKSMLLSAVGQTMGPVKCITTRTSMEPNKPDYGKKTLTHDITWSRR